jgi:hypothetical protein
MSRATPEKVEYTRQSGVHSVSDDATGGLARSVLAATEHLLYVPYFTVILGLILLLNDVIGNRHGHSVIGIRMILFGFGWQFWHSSSFGRADWGRRFAAIMFLTAAAAPLRYLLWVYGYLK